MTVTADATGTPSVPDRFIPPLALPGGWMHFTSGPAVMAVVNVTPDSFSDGGRLYPDHHPDAAVVRARRLAAEGAAVLDVGGESSRPGAEPVSVDEELRRVMPVIAGLSDSGTVVSVDTTKAEVARAAIAAGAAIVNDVSGGRDPQLLEAVAESGAAYVLMHMRGTPADMQSRTQYDDVVAEVCGFLADGLDRCQRAGIPHERVVIDPGLGFAKTADHNLRLLARVRRLRELGRPVLIGASRKSFLGAILSGTGTDDRLEGSLACAAIAVAEGAAMLRVHDVAATVRTAATVHAIVAAGAD